MFHHTAPLPLLRGHISSSSSPSSFTPAPERSLFRCHHSRPFHLYIRPLLHYHYHLATSHDICCSCSAHYQYIYYEGKNIIARHYEATLLRCDISASREELIIIHIAITTIGDEERPLTLWWRDMRGSEPLRHITDRKASVVWRTYGDDALRCRAEVILRLFSLSLNGLCCCLINYATRQLLHHTHTHTQYYYCYCMPCYRHQCHQ